MSSEYAIQVQDISKHYLMFERPEDRLKQSIVPRFQRWIGRQPKQYYRDFAALSNISFDVARGETIGIVGRNGSGKSTLLQIICGTLQPTSGTLKVNGRIAALLELGAGFNPEFTGRENVFLNASILGLTNQETEARFDDIARFADIGNFIEQPVKTYSSGMYVRLAFATAINVDPDILVVDEALAVGDEAFQRKCYARIEDIKEKGGTILFVSHGAQTIVQLCDRAMLIDRGEKILEGRPKSVVSQYQRLVNLSGSEAETVRAAIKALEPPRPSLTNGTAAAKPEGPNGTISTFGQQDEEPTSTEADVDLVHPDDESWLDENLKSVSYVETESRGARISEMKVFTRTGREVNVLVMGGQYSLEYRVDYERDAKDLAFGMAIRTVNGIDIAGTTTYLHKQDFQNCPAGGSAIVRIPFKCSLAPGVYFFNAGTGVRRQGEWQLWHRVIDGLAFRVEGQERLPFTGFVDLGLKPNVSLKHRDTASFTDNHER
ncbi:MAG: ABC transporter ATP-binding protein [Hyphomicrobiaceae bacterium]